MVSKLLVACLLSAALAFLLLVSSGTNVKATTYEVVYPFVLECGGADGEMGPPGGTADDNSCDCATGGANDLDECADIHTVFNVPQTDWAPTEPRYSNFGRITSFHAPPEWGVGRDYDTPVGAFAGMLFSQTTLSLAGSACPGVFNAVAPLPLYHCSVDKSNMIGWVGDGTNLTEDADGDGIPNGCEKYPSFVDEIVGGVQPRMRLYAFNHMPMDGERSGDDFDFYWLDAVASQRVRFTEADHGSPLYFRWGVGWSLLYLDAEEEHDMGGAGLVGRLGLGSCFGSHAGVEVFGDVHGWVGLDADDARAAWGASLGISLFIAF